MPKKNKLEEKYIFKNVILLFWSLEYWNIFWKYWDKKATKSTKLVQWIIFLKFNKELINLVSVVSEEKTALSLENLSWNGMRYGEEKLKYLDNV